MCQGRCQLRAEDTDTNSNFSAANFVGSENGEEERNIKHLNGSEAILSGWLLKSRQAEEN